MWKEVGFFFYLNFTKAILINAALEHFMYTWNAVHTIQCIVYIVYYTLYGNHSKLHIVDSLLADGSVLSKCSFSECNVIE